jgi:hypothetical protein
MGDVTHDLVGDSEHGHFSLGISVIFGHFMVYKGRRQG